MKFCMNLNTLLALSIDYKLYTKAPRVSWVTLSTFMKTREHFSPMPYHCTWNDPYRLLSFVVNGSLKACGIRKGFP